MFGVIKRYGILGCIIPFSSVAMADVDLSFLMPNTVVPNACIFENTGVYSGEFVMVPVYEDTIYTCEQGYYLPMESEICARCPENAYCPGGEYTYSENGAVGLNGCPDGTFAPDGMWELAQCGRKLHVDDAIVYLRTTPGTSPALRFDVDADGVADYFANLATDDVPMNKNTERKLKIKSGDVVYFVCDDTIEISLDEQ